MKAMETIEDLVEEAKTRTVWWAMCIFALTYILSHTSTSMWMNLPIAVLFVCGLRMLSNQVEISWKVRGTRTQTYLSRLEKKQLSVNDLRLSSAPPQAKWKRKIDSVVVEAEINNFIDKILKDFVVDLWYSEITPDRDAPELIRAVILDAISEISWRAKDINLVNLLTKDVVDLIGDHLDLFRRNQAAIGVDVMKTLSSEERDKRLKHQLMISKELHPALISPESEYKVLQRLVAGILSVVLKPREAQCPLVRTIAREIVTCLILQPLLNFASPGFINELIELIVLAIKTDSTKEEAGAQHAKKGPGVDSTSQKSSSFGSKKMDMQLVKVDDRKITSSDYKVYKEMSVHPPSSDWARMLEVASKRRTDVLTPENLENMWTKGRNYKKKDYRKDAKKESIVNAASTGNIDKEAFIRSTATPSWPEEKAIARLTPGLSLDTQLHDGNTNKTLLPQDFDKASSYEGTLPLNEIDNINNLVSDGNYSRFKRSNSTSDLKPQHDTRKLLLGDDGGPIITEFYSSNLVKHNKEFKTKQVPSSVLLSEGPHFPKLRCRVIGAYFEKLGSKSFAVYSIAVTDVENKTWFVKRRYSNFERLHRQLKVIPNYTLHLPPKRIFSSSTEDAIVHQRCIQLDKYLQDLLSIANVAEQHEVWDFLSASSKCYAFGKSSSVMRTLAVNVDDAVDDIVRQFKGVSDGLMRKVVGSSSTYDGIYSPESSNLSWHVDEMSHHVGRHINSETVNNTSDIEEDGKDGDDVHEEDHSDNELDYHGLPPRVITNVKDSGNLHSEEKHILEMESQLIGHDRPSATDRLCNFDHLEDPVGVPPEWAPPNVSIPILNLVDKVFQLKRRGWLRRQVFWISEQIVHLVMEDAIDDWLLRQIYWIRKEDTVAQGIRWLEDVLWPNGIFFTRVADNQSQVGDTPPSPKPFQKKGQLDDSKGPKPKTFEEELEATRRASEFKKLLFDGAPTTLVSLIGGKQYRRCARDIYYFTQSTICVKQLTFAIVELLIKSVFPELRDLLTDLHENVQFEPK